jgi:hypothetical protein
MYDMCKKKSNAKASETPEGSARNRGKRRGREGREGTATDCS